MHTVDLSGEIMRAIHFFIRLCITALAGLPWVHSASAAPEYRVTVVGPPDSVATGINNAGVVVGRHPAYAESTRAFLSRGRGWTDLPALGVSSGATGINDRGQVIGNWTTAKNQGRGVIWHRGIPRDIGIAPGNTYTYYIAINNAGYTVARVGAGRSYLRSPQGAFRDLGYLPATDPITDAQAVNNRNQVAGATGPLSFPELPFRSFLWHRGVMRDLGDFGSTPNVGTDINDRGQITGFAAVNTSGAHDRVAFIYTHGRLRDIDGRPTTGERFSQGQGINNHGHAVGDSDHLSGWVYRGRRMQSLNALIDPAPGWNIQAPRDINDAGQIAATAVRNGQYYAVRLDPVRPSLDAVPALDADAAAEIREIDPPGTPEQAAADAQQDREAQARETVRQVE
jgi:uncharacterized membrane protein